MITMMMMVISMATPCWQITQWAGSQRIGGMSGTIHNVDEDNVDDEHDDEVDDDDVEVNDDDVAQTENNRNVRKR